MRWTCCDWSLILRTCLPSVLWHCRLGHFKCTRYDTSCQLLIGEGGSRYQWHHGVFSMYKTQYGCHGLSRRYDGSHHHECDLLWARSPIRERHIQCADPFWPPTPECVVLQTLLQLTCMLNANQLCPSRREYVFPVQTLSTLWMTG